MKGALRRDETNDVYNFDQYLQASLQMSPRWSANAGVRHSRVSFESEDHYIVGTNPDDSGSVAYSATLPVLGVMFAASDSVHLYATAGRGFETPTLNELAYRPSGQTGLNLALQAARSKSLEIGAKFRFAPGGEATAAAFETHTTDEIVTQTNVGGRSTFQNAGATRRRGIELSAAAELGNDLRLQGAYTWLDARYRDPFQTCAGVPCTTPTLTIPADNRIPGTAQQLVLRLARLAAAARLARRPRGAGAEQGLGQRRQQRRRRRLCHLLRLPRLPGADRRLRAERLRPHRQPVRPCLRRLGDRRRRQRALLRAGARPHLDGRRLGRASLLKGRRR